MPKHTMAKFTALKKSDLPPVIKGGQGLTQLVRVRKWGGKIYQDCDVWIGDEIRNSSWSFNKSRWANPFPFNRRKERHESLQQYRAYILSDPELRKGLQELKGKRLGCMCSHDLKPCHGHVLIDLIEKTKNHVVSRDMYFFKGIDSPLSNLYPFHFFFNGGKYNSVYQAMMWEKADRWENEGKEKLKKDILETLTPMDTFRFIANHKEFREAHPWSGRESVCVMYKLLSHKWRQCLEFREIATKYRMYYFIEATKNKFFGCGVDLHQTLEKEFHALTFDELEGKNILGWLIKYLALKNVDRVSILYNWCDDQDEEMCELGEGLYYILYDCFPLLRENRAERGARLYEDVVTLHSQYE